MLATSARSTRRLMNRARLDQPDLPEDRLKALPVAPQIVLLIQVRAGPQRVEAVAPQILHGVGDDRGLLLGSPERRAPPAFDSATRRLRLLEEAADRRDHLHCEHRPGHPTHHFAGLRKGERRIFPAPRWVADVRGDGRWASSTGSDGFAPL